MDTARIIMWRADQESVTLRIWAENDCGTFVNASELTLTQAEVVAHLAAIRLENDQVSQLTLPW